VCAVAPDDAEHGTLRAMARVVRQTQSAPPAPGVNLADDAAAQQFRRSGRALDHPDKFMAERALKASVAARNLDIRITDAAQGHAHHGLALVARTRHPTDPYTLILIT
jgi:hypothetical protein